MARSVGFEPTTAWFVARYSIQLSYERVKAVNSNYFGVNCNPALSFGLWLHCLKGDRCSVLLKRRYNGKDSLKCWSHSRSY